MNEGFRELVERLHPQLERLLEGSPIGYKDLPRVMPDRGIYLFSEGGRHLYVGRTNRIRKRLQSHCRPSGTHFTATFAFRLAREFTNRTTASYAKVGSRGDLLSDPEFATAFQAAKLRVASMDIRFVEEVDPVRQALLEIYVATVLRTPYNDFDNH
jgi:hypothetical protein